MAVRPRKPRRILRWLGVLLVLAMLLGIAAAIPAGIIAREWADEGILLADAHARHNVAHPGWSFPARVYAPAVGLTEPPKRLVAEAKARGYDESCKTTEAGQFCGKTGVVIPRTGDALEPVLLGWLLGPDGELREHLPLSEAPKLLTDAIVAAEDHDYATHHGVNVKGLIRAVWANAQEGGYAQGGSTLTMQVVRNLNQRREKTVARKLREIVIAVAIDDHLGKDGVMQMYLDAPYLGQRGSISVCGFQSAAKHYFGKDARRLSLEEAATLAGILPAPGKFAPDRFPEKAKERRDRVLEQMRTQFGYDVTAALGAPIATVEPEPFPERYPAYLSATRAWLDANLSPTVLYGAGLVVTTGLDIYSQEEAERLFPAKMRFFESILGRKRSETLQSAGVLLDVDTGLIRAVYGGDDVTSISFNRATQAQRQPGSSFKPLVYALAFDARNADGSMTYTPASTMPNEPRDFKTSQGIWRPRNVGGEYSTTASLAYGLAWSQNIATASLLEANGGPKALIAFATKVGFETGKFPEEMGLALGQAEVTPLEMAQFAATVSSGGHKITGSPVLSAVDASGQQRVAAPVAGEFVMSPEAAALTRELMRLVIEVGTGGASRGAAGEGGYPGPAIGKTGTTDGEKDLWFVGATPKRAMAVWIGYDVPTPLGAAASDLAAPLWGWWMNRVSKHDEQPLPDWVSEPKVIRKGLCTVSGKGMNASCRGIPTPFIEGKVPKIAGCPIEHPPPEPVVEGEAVKPGHESLWKKLERERLEAAGEVPASGAVPVAPP